MSNYDIKCEVRTIGSGTTYVPCEDYGISFAIDSCSKEDFVSKCKVRISNNSDREFEGVIHLKFPVLSSDPQFFMPGFMYGRNTGDMPSSGRKSFPRIREICEQMPESRFWMTRSDRLAEPMSLICDGGAVFGIAASPYWVKGKDGIAPADLSCGESEELVQFAGFTCSMDDGCSSVGYTIGYENAPWLFVQSATVLDRAPVEYSNSVVLRAGEELVCDIFIYDYQGSEETSIYKAIRHAYDVYHQSPRTIPGMDEVKAVSMLMGAIRDYAWLEDDKMYSGFVYDREDGFSYNKIGSLTWTNGLSVVTPMLIAADKLHDDKARSQCLEFMEEVVAKSYNPSSGLLYEAVDNRKWSVRGWWYDGMHSGGHSGYLNGQAVYYILKAYNAEKDLHGVVHDDWLELAGKVITKFNEIKNSDGEYPFAMSETTGAGIEYDSMGSSWCLAATVLYAQITQDDSYIDSCIMSEKHYYNSYVRKAQCYGGPLDTDKAVDDEGILAYIRAARILHELTGDEVLLKHMGYALDYEVSFKLGYNTRILVPPLSENGWSSCGGSITSTANPHIHPMSSTIIDEMNYYVEHTGDSYMASRLEDTILWSMQTFNLKDKEYGYGKIGWMSERFCFCQGLLTETYPDGSPASTWFALMPWASGSIIEGLVSLIN